MEKIHTYELNGVEYEIEDLEARQGLTELGDATTQSLDDEALARATADNEIKDIIGAKNLVELRSFSVYVPPNGYGDVKCGDGTKEGYTLAGISLRNTYMAQSSFPTAGAYSYGIYVGVINLSNSGTTCTGQVVLHWIKD